jgi:hypothetical protein
MLIHSFFTKIGGMGLGDFIRGSIAAQQVCYRHRLDFNMDFSRHPISKYLINKCDYPIQNTDNILTIQNYGSCNSLTLKNKLLDATSFKTLRKRKTYIYTNVWPIFPITPQLCTDIKKFLQPNNILKSAIHERIPKKQYKIVHIRAGDLLSFKKQIGNNIDYDLDTLINMLHPHLKALSGKNYIILSDCVVLKQFLSKKYGFIDIETTPVHLTLENNDILDTLIDYFLMSKAKEIHQFSVYPWGSGFSESINWLYGVPIIKHKLVL